MAGRNRSEILKVISAFLAELKKKNIRISAAYLFGSYANGKPDEWSDVDLALVTPDLEGNSFDFLFELTKLAKKIDLDLEPHPISEADFPIHPLHHEIIAAGIRVEIQ
ncbi:MAG: nucleotidyltransferase domain-containing protein [Candidatus Wallbacteria bacterium]|nr:nucleotidyltransferase domain-containing protein [Candidatus Wallbacteria bacterium]